MEHLIRGVRDAVEKRSWYSATALGLMLPDVCAAIEEPGRGQSKQRYIRWAERWTQGHFTAPTGKVFLSSAELYQVRCAFLHEGDFVTSDETPQAADDSAAMFEVLNQVTLYDDGQISVMPSRGMMTTGSERITTYSIGVGGLCEWICTGVESWLSDSTTNSRFAERIERIRRTGVILQLPG